MHVVLDDTAMVPPVTATSWASRLISWAHTGSGWLLYASVCALVEADRTRPGVAEHFAAMPAITVLELDLPAALAVARDATWAEAHTRYAAGPAPDRPRRSGHRHRRLGPVEGPARPRPRPQALTGGAGRAATPALHLAPQRDRVPDVSRRRAGTGRSAARTHPSRGTPRRRRATHRPSRNVLTPRPTLLANSARLGLTDVI
jgi:hypothetical protein